MSTCLTCRSEVDLPRWVYMRHDGAPDILHASVSGRPPLEPVPPATRYGPYCARCAALELDRLRLGAGRPAVAPRADFGPAGCHCGSCLEKAGHDPQTGLPWTVEIMSLCTECGNKRCPKATNHELSCSGSNLPGQPGSIYA